MSDPPIVCTLSAGELTQRLAEIAEVGRRALLGVSRDGGVAVLRFRARAGIRDRLAAIVAAELRCCAFLDMTLQDDGDALALTIVAPRGAELVVDELVATFATQVRPA